VCILDLLLIAIGVFVVGILNPQGAIMMPQIHNFVQINANIDRRGKTLFRIFTGAMHVV
jgi:hypothetical protein